MTSDYFTKLPVCLQHDAMTLLCGDELGAGASRRVFTCNIAQDLVVKVEWKKSFHNAAEWEIWDRIKSWHAAARWFAPCVHISTMGGWMLQRRTTPVTVEELRRKLPRIPVFFDDVAARNWGRLGAHYVCHDYGYLRTLEYGLRLKLVKAKWRE